MNGQVDTFSLIGDISYNNEPRSGLEIFYPDRSVFKMGRRANSGFLIRLDNPTYSEATTLDYECADFVPPVAVNDSKEGVSGTPTIVNILNNDSNALENNNSTNNNSLAPSEYGRSSVSLTAPTGATGIVTDAKGRVRQFTVPGEGLWVYDDNTGALTFTPDPSFVGFATTIDYTFTNALGIASNTATVTVWYPGIGVTKSSIFNDTNADTYGQVGETIDYIYQVKSYGAEPLQNISITETGFTGAGTAPVPAYDSGDANTDNMLGLTETWTYKATYTIVAADLTSGAVTNSATGSGQTAAGTSVSDTSDSSNPGDGNGIGTSAPGPNNGDPTRTSFINAPVAAGNDVQSGTIYSGGMPNAYNALDNDTLKTVAATLAAVTLTVETPASNAGVFLDPATGLVSVAAGTPAGSYSIGYKICETANPTNCATATASIVVSATLPITAALDAPAPVNGVAGGNNFINALTNDRLNGVAVAIGDINLTVETPASNAGVTLDPATGLVSVAPGTPAGSYTIEYKICEKVNPANCATSTITVVVKSTPLTAADDNVPAVNGATGNPAAFNAFANDMLNGAPVAANDINATVTAAATPKAPGAPVPALDPATGNVAVPAGTPAGSYTIGYEICEKADPTNCKPATITVVVAAAPIAASNDSAGPVTSAAGGSNLVNALTNDELNSAPVVIANINLAVTTPALNPGVTLDPATGLVSVAPGTPAGSYTIIYEICEKLNAANCALANVVVQVNPSPIVADADTPAPVSGAGGDDIINAFANDQLNGAPVVLGDINATVTTPASRKSPGAPVPVLDPTTGFVDVPANTPAGTYLINYEICEKANPLNCANASVTVIVTAAPVAATNDSATGLNGATGVPSALNVLAGDSINGVAATLANATLSVATGSSVPSQLSFDPATGIVGVNPGTPAGTYSFDYQICETLNPANCKTATASVTVDPSPIVASNDSASGVNGIAGATAVANAFTADTVNNVAASPANATLSVKTGTTVPAGLTFDTATGSVDVAAGTPAGSYVINYTICETLNPANCKDATITVDVVAAPVASTNDSATGLNGATGVPSALNVLAGDSINGVAATLANATLSVATGSTVPAQLSFDPATGIVGINPGTPAGTYSFDYQICETLNPANCKTATASVTVDPSPIVASNDSASGINGIAGATAVANAFTADTVNNVAASPANATLSVKTGTTVPAGLTFDTATGSVDVAAGTPAGSYVINYTICETLNPANCKDATITVDVVAAPVASTNDSATGLNGATGVPSALNVLAGDSINGVAATLANATLSVATGSSVPSQLSFDPATGIVGVNPGTPAGTYSFDYQICETLNPANCKTATASVTVDPSPIVASNDSASGVNGIAGATAVANAFTADTVNNVAASPANATLSVKTGTTVPAGLTFDTATGSVDVAAGTPAGSYVINYTICETLNPANCKDATITVDVVAAPVASTNDSATGLNGATGVPSALNVLAGDSINGVAATLANATLSVATGSSVPSQLSFDPATGIVGVNPGTPAGTYSFDYQICETLNPANCKTATASVTVDPSPIVASNDSASGVNGIAGATAVANAFTADTVNNVAASPANATLSVKTGTTVPAGLTFDTATGSVDVAAGTPAGSYVINYTICETLNPANCKDATITVDVVAAPVASTNDSATGLNGATGVPSALNVLAGDSINGVAATLANATLSVATGSSVPSQLSFDPATGIVGVNPGTPAGTYSFDYQICETLNPANCKTATASVTVDPSPIVASNDSASGVNGIAGATAVANAFTADTVNNVAASPANATLSVKTGTTVPAGLTFDTATGSVDVAAGTPAGSYVINYTICETLNPANCKDATITVDVVAAPVASTNDSATGLNGATGVPSALNVLAGDSINGVAATLANATLSVATGSTVPAQLSFDPATGIVGINPGTPAGTYSFDYQICETLNPANCKTATASVTVDPSPIVASNDSASGINGIAGATAVANAFTADTVNNVAASPSNATLSVKAGTTVPAGLTFDTATGSVDVAAGTPAGSYVINYTICETLNPANCKDATITVDVVAAPVAATNDSAGPVTTALGGSNLVNALTNDTLNGIPVVLSDIVLAVTAPAANAGVTLDPATGQVSVAPGTPAGNYTIGYQICEKLNSANCATATIAVVVNATPIAASNDVPAAINGNTGNPNAINVFANDTFNGAPVDPAAINTTIKTPASNPGVVLDPVTGNVSVAPGTPAGTYTIIYEICEKANPSNCQTATVTVVVNAGPIAATPDAPAPVNGTIGGNDIINALTNDTLNGVPVVLADVTVTVTAPATPVLGGALVPVLDPATGLVDVPAGTPAGTYTIGYQICEKLNPANCADTVVTVVVTAAPLAATPDTPPAVNGTAGNPAVTNAFANDMLNGSPVDPAAIVATVKTPASNPGVVLDPATGNVSVAPGTPAGSYTITYEICEKLNPANCATSTVTVVVAAAPIAATNDDAGTVPGNLGGKDLINALVNDSLNGGPADITKVDLTVTAPAPNPGVTLDPATGLVSVAANTPAGTYSIGYQICEKLNPANCATATVAVIVQAAAIAASPDAPAPVNGSLGGNDIINAFANDMLNGAPVVPADITATVTTPAAPVTPGAPVPVLDPATGLVDVPAGTPAGTYNIGYQICEKLNPANCATSAVTVVVEPPAIVAANDVPAPIRQGIGNPSAINVFANDMLNGVLVDPALINAVILQPAANSGVVLDPITGNVSVAAGVPAGTYVIEYQICEKLNPANCKSASVTVVVEPALSAVTGTVFTDFDGDHVIDANEPRRVGWIVEIMHGGVKVETAITDSNGNYRVEGLPSGPGYDIVFRNPENNVVYDQIKGVTLGANTTVIDQNQPIDPSGVFYDLITRQPIAGVRAVLADANGVPLPTICFVDASQANQTTGASGEYRFDIVPGAAPQCPVTQTVYQIIATPPAGYAPGSTVLLPQPGPFDPTGLPAPVRINPDPTPPTGSSTPFYLSFNLAAGDPDIVNNHIALDPFLTRTPLIVTKTSIKRAASVGDIVPYEITVRNTENVQRAGVTVVDILPSGMKYVIGTALVNGIAQEPVKTDRQLAWTGQVIPASGSVRYNLTLIVGAGVTGGEKVNTGLAQNGADNAAISNRGTAVISITPNAVFDCSELLGKVFEDTNRNGYQDENEPGVPGVRLVTVNGQLITTDEFGRYHIACAAVPDARIGSNFVLKVDTRTLPLGWDTTTDNPRSIRLTRGKFGELNFGVAPKETRSTSPGAPTPGTQEKGE